MQVFEVLLGILFFGVLEVVLGDINDYFSCLIPKICENYLGRCGHIPDRILC